MWILTENHKVITIKNNDPEAAVKSVRFCADESAINLILRINNPKSLNFISDIREASFENCATEMPGYRIKVDSWHQLFIVKAHPVDFAAQRDLIVSTFAIPLDRLLMCAKHVADKTQPCCTIPSASDLHKELVVGADEEPDKEKIQTAAAIGHYIDQHGFKWSIQTQQPEQLQEYERIVVQGLSLNSDGVHDLESKRSHKPFIFFSNKFWRLENKWKHSSQQNLSCSFLFDAHRYTFTWQQDFEDQCDEVRYTHEKVTKSSKEALKLKLA